MEKALLKLTDLFAQTPNLILNYKKQVLAGLIGASLFLFYGIFSFTSFDMSTDSFLEEKILLRLLLMNSDAVWW